MDKLFVSCLESKRADKEKLLCTLFIMQCMLIHDGEFHSIDLQLKKQSELLWHRQCYDSINNQCLFKAISNENELARVQTLISHSHSSVNSEVLSLTLIRSYPIWACSMIHLIWLCTDDSWSKLLSNFHPSTPMYFQSHLVLPLQFVLEHTISCI